MIKYIKQHETNYLFWIFISRSFCFSQWNHNASLRSTISSSVRGLHRKIRKRNKVKKKVLKVQV